MTSAAKDNMLLTIARGVARSERGVAAREAMEKVAAMAWMGTMPLAFTGAPSDAIPGLAGAVALGFSQFRQKVADASRDGREPLWSRLSVPAAGGAVASLAMVTPGNPGATLSPEVATALAGVVVAAISVAFAPTRDPKQKATRRLG